MTSAKVKFTVRDGFGDALYEADLKADIRIAPGTTRAVDGVYQWDDNPYINDEPYDRFAPAVRAGTAKIETKVLSVAFSDGTTIGAAP